MRLSELIGAPVCDREGKAIGRVRDVRAMEVAAGGAGNRSGPRVRVEGFVAGGSALGVRLGYDRFGLKEPWVLAALFRRLERRARFVEWTQVDRFEEGTVRLHVAVAEVRSLHDELQRMDG